MNHLMTDADDQPEEIKFTELDVQYLASAVIADSTLHWGSDIIEKSDIADMVIDDQDFNAEIALDVFDYNLLTAFEKVNARKIEVAENLIRDTIEQKNELPQVRG